MKETAQVGVTKVRINPDVKEIKIQKTSDYTKFKKLPGNRDINRRVVYDLMASFQEKPQLRIARPVLTNENFEVIDGQHRLEASKKMHLPIYYMVVPALDTDDARLLNALQRNWKLLDYAESFAATGDPEYQRFVELYQQYSLPPTIILDYCLITKGGSGGVRSTGFKLGKFTIENEDKTVEALQKLQSFEEFTPLWTNASFALAVLRLLRNTSYDHDRMMKKLEDGNTIVKRGAAYDFLRDLEIIYNRGVSPSNVVRFI